MDILINIMRKKCTLAGPKCERQITDGLLVRRYGQQEKRNEVDDGRMLGRGDETKKVAGIKCNQQSQDSGNGKSLNFEVVTEQAEDDDVYNDHRGISWTDRKREAQLNERCALQLLNIHVIQI